MTTPDDATGAQAPYLQAQTYDEETLWKSKAACKGLAANMFIPENRGVQNIDLYSAARAVCNSCIVKMECLRHAILKNETLGMWGGLTPDERRALGYGSYSVCVTCGKPYRRDSNSQKSCNPCRNQQGRSRSTSN